MDMLRRLQESDEAEFGLNEVDPDEESGGLADNLQNLDLGQSTSILLYMSTEIILVENISPEELLSYLSDEQRKAFEDILKDPQKAQALLDLNQELDDPAIYWWQTSMPNEDVKGKGRERPLPLDKTLLLPVSSQSALPLEYNLLAIM